MPELPEVEVVRRGLTTHLVGRRIAESRSSTIAPCAGTPAVPRTSGPCCPATAITAVRRRGKYLWWALDDGDAVIAHLGMSGQFRVGAGPDRFASYRRSQADRRIRPATRSAADHPHLRIRFAFDDDGPDIDFLDQRTFGGMAFAAGRRRAAGRDRAHRPGSAGPGILDGRKRLPRSGTRRPRSNAPCWTRRWCPGSATSTPTRRSGGPRCTTRGRPRGMTRAGRRRACCSAATEVMTQALAVGGTSFDALYVNVNGESGYFDRSLNAYGQQDRPCPRCGTPIRRDAFMNRSSFFCPNCQRPPRNTGRTR